MNTTAKSWQQIKSDSDVVGPIEIGELLHLHPRTVKRLSELGEIPGVRLGKQWRYSRKAVMEIFDRGSSTELRR